MKILPILIIIFFMASSCATLKKENGEKREVVEYKFSDAEIACHVGVAHTFIALVPEKKEQHDKRFLYQSLVADCINKVNGGVK